MNKLLAEALSFLNGFMALLTVLVGGLLGFYLGPYCIGVYAALIGRPYTGTQSQAEITGMICGLLLAFGCAVVVYGLLALFIQMHRELKAIRQLLVEQEVEEVKPPTVRREPTLA